MSRGMFTGIEYQRTASAVWDLIGSSTPEDANRAAVMREYYSLKTRWNSMSREERERDNTIKQQLEEVIQDVIYLGGMI